VAACGTLQNFRWCYGAFTGQEWDGNIESKGRETRKKKREGRMEREKHLCFWGLNAPAYSNFVDPDQCISAQPNCQ